VAGIEKRLSRLEAAHKQERISELEAALEKQGTPA
jgi:hypothetical protein